MRSAARYWLPPLVWMAVIWSASSDLGSADHTVGPVSWLVSVLVSWATPAQIDFAHWLVRKLGHLTEYAILAVLWFRTLHTGRRLASVPSAAAALTLSIAWAMADELHQSFVPSRTASALDVMIDGIGAMASVLILYSRTTLGRISLRPSPRSASI